MMKPITEKNLSLWKEHPVMAALAAVGAIALCVAVVLLVKSWSGSASAGGGKPTPAAAKVKRVVSGHYVKLEDDEKLVYAGIRTPYDNEPMHQEAKKRNDELVTDREVRIEYDKQERDDEGRLVGYAFLGDGSMVNVTLVREGLAYARLTPAATRHADAILAAQTEARLGKRGMWKNWVNKSEKVVADPKYAEFHRPSCEVSQRLSSERRTEFEDHLKALNRGFAPCNKCVH